MVVDPKESPKSKQPKLLLIFFLSTLPIVLFLGLLHYQMYSRLESRAVLENAAAVRLVVRSVQEHFKRLMNYTEDFSRQIGLLVGLGIRLLAAGKLEPWSPPR